MNGEEFPVHFQSININSINFNFKYSHEKNEVFICTVEGKIFNLNLFDFEFREVYSNSKYEFKIIEIYENYLFCFTEKETLILKDEKEYFTFQKSMSSVELFDDGLILWNDNQNIFTIDIRSLINKSIKFEKSKSYLFHFDFIKKIGNQMFVVDLLFGGVEIYEYPSMNLEISIDHIDVKSVTHDKENVYFGYDSNIEVFDFESWRSLRFKNFKFDIRWIFQHEDMLIVKLFDGLHFIDKETLKEHCSVDVEPKSQKKVKNEKYVESSKHYFMFSNLEYLEIWKLPNNTKLQILSKGKNFDLFFHFH
jgi:hypothetical protein